MGKISSYAVVRKREKLTGLFKVREGTSDEKAILEVWKKNSYQRKEFQVEPGERWLDLGANIGAFGSYALVKGAAFVMGVEAEQYNALAAREHYAAHSKNSNWTVLQKAVVADNFAGDTARFWVNYRPMLLRRHSLTKPPESKPARWADVPVVKFSSLTRGFDCVKMNIEGAEIELLENVADWGDVRKLVFEYSFDKDPSIPRFLAIQAKLRTHFRTVETRERIPNLPAWPHYPPSCFCFCSI